MAEADDQATTAAAPSSWAAPEIHEIPGKTQFAEARFEGTGGLKPPGVQIFEHRERLHDAPGRPSSRELVRDEAKRRVAAGIAAKPLNAFGHDLSAWLRENHPGLPQMKGRSIENVVRDIWQRTQSNI